MKSIRSSGIVCVPCPWVPGSGSRLLYHGGPREHTEHVDCRAFVGAVGAEEADDLAAYDGERDAADGLDLAVGVGEPGDINCGWCEGMGEFVRGECAHCVLR